jgi:hypothetical protein
MNTAFDLSSFHEFTAKCESGPTHVSIYGGQSSNNSFQHIGVEPHVPSQHCQSEFAQAYLLDFNAMKRCYWELIIPWDCGSDCRTLAAASPPRLASPLAILALQLPPPPPPPVKKTHHNFLSNFLRSSKRSYCNDGNNQNNWRACSQQTVHCP